MTDTRGTFQIPAENLDWFKAQIAKLSRKSVKLLGPEWEINPVVFSYATVKGADGFERKVYDVLLAAKEPKLADWEFLARLDHANEVGTIIRSVPGKTMPAHFHKADALNCDHCHTRRARRDTFVVHNVVTDQFMQVGSTCLKDFLGHDVEKIAKLAEMLMYANEIGGMATQLGSFSMADRRWISLDKYLAYVAATIRTSGWTSRRDAMAYGKTATADTAYALMGNEITIEESPSLTGKDRDTAAAALAWAQSLTDAQREANDYLHNIYVVAASGIIESRSIGLAGSIVGSFLRNESRKVPQSVTIDNVAGIVALLQRGKSPKLKHPKIIVRVNNTDLRLSLCGSKSRYEGSVNVTSADGDWDGRDWYGRIERDTGKFVGARRAGAVTQTAILQALQALAADPAGIAAAYGKLTGNCCFCNRSLTHENSVDVGYGRTCAGHYGLPWGVKVAAAETTAA